MKTDVMMNAKVLVFASFKGGTSKTTTSTNLAQGLADRGYKVLFCDLDAQANGTDTLLGGQKIIETNQCISNPLRDKNIPVHVIPIKQNLDLIGANYVSMMGLEIELQLLPVGSERQFDRLLKPFRSQYDFIVVDTPPVLNTLTTNACYAADRIVITFKVGKFSLDGLEKIEYQLDKYLDKQPTDIVHCIKENNVINKDASKFLEEYRPTQFLRNSIRKYVSYEEANLESISIFEKDPDSNATRDFNRFIDELLTRINNG